MYDREIFILVGFTKKKREITSEHKIPFYHNGYLN